MQYQVPNSDWYSKKGLTPPQALTHGTDSDIRQNLKELKPKQWRQEGNRLIGETEMGEVVQFLPINYILTGTDEKGLPILKKLG